MNVSITDWASQIKGKALQAKTGEVQGPRCVSVLYYLVGSAYLTRVTVVLRDKYHHSLFFDKEVKQGGKNLPTFSE